MTGWLRLASDVGEAVIDSHLVVLEHSLVQNDFPARPDSADSFTARVEKTAVVAKAVVGVAIVVGGEVLADGLESCARHEPAQTKNHTIVSAIAIQNPFAIIEHTHPNFSI
jgi:hypothetical protein